MSIRIHKLLATSGHGSLRSIEKLIIDKQVTINGKIAQIGATANVTDTICIAGKLVKLAATTPTRIILYNKPAEQICTRHDPKKRDSVFDHLPKLTQGRWISVGRLDFNTQGLLIFTNNGQLAHKLMHPSSGLEREYAVRVHGKVTDVILNKLRTGVMLADGFAQFMKLNKMGGANSNCWFKVSVNQGRNRLVRRLWETQNITVSRLIRIKFGNFTLPHELPQRKWLELTQQTAVDI